MFIREYKQTLTTLIPFTKKRLSSFSKDPLKIKPFTFPLLTIQSNPQRTYSTDQSPIKGFLNSIFSSKNTLNKRVIKNPSPLVSKLSKCPPPTKQEFIEAVRQFEEKMKLEDFLQGKISDLSFKQIQMREDFFSNKIIQGYLSRNSKHVDFLENKPNFSIDEKKFDSNDYYENKIYQNSFTENIGPFPYRQSVINDSFYNKGAEDLSIFKNISLPKTENCQILPRSMDVFEIKQQIRLIEVINKPEINRNNFTFLLSPNYKDNHATTIVSIFNKTTRKHLVSIFINSSQSDDYYKYIEGNFNLRSIMDLLLEGDEAEEIYNYVQKKLNTEPVIIDLENKEAFVDLSQASIENKARIEASLAFRNEKIDFIHKISVNKKGEKIYSCDGTRYTPLLDASHHLQTEEDDQNCSLYSFNFLQGISDMLDNEVLSEKAYQLALKIDSGTLEEKQEATRTLISIFQEDLKKHVPIYYDTNKNKKSLADIKEQHLLQRWDFGSLSMDLDSLREKGYLKKAD